MSFDLPDKFTPEWVQARQWRKTEYANLELCNLGVFRRPQGAQHPGKLVYASPNKDFSPRFRITKLGGTKEKYVLDVKDLMIEIFGRFDNKRLLEYNYLKHLKVLSVEYNLRYFKCEMSKEDSKLLGMNDGFVIGKRLCAGVNGVSCGKMIRDYRCAACWARVRGDQDLDREVEEVQIYEQPEVFIAGI